MHKHHDRGVRWRSGEITRIEGLSDAVFAFAVTLLVVSLEVPKSFEELTVVMRGFVPFGICFVLLMLVWYDQYVFFRRYNLQDSVTITLNAVLLFLVLFYVYPLKFLFTFLVSAWTGGHPHNVDVHQMPHLMAIFSGGYLAVSIIFVLLFHRALRKREELELNEIEVFETKVSIGASGLNASVAAISLGIALFADEKMAGLSGIIYPVLLAPANTIFYTIMGKKKDRITAAPGA